MKKKRLRPRRRGLFRQKPLSEAEIKKEIRSLLKPRFRIECYYVGFDPALDRKIARLSRKRSDGSGMLMSCGLRDLSFEGFASKAKATAAARRIKKKLPQVRVMLRSFEVAR